MNAIFSKIRRQDSPCGIGSQSGATAVEFALVLWLLTLLLFGMIEWGLYFFNRQVLANACREGARAGIVSRAARLSNAEIEQVVRDFSERHLVTFGSNTLTVPIKPIDDDMRDGFDPSTNRCTRFGCDLAVSARFTYTFLFLPAIGIDSLDIETVAQMKME